MYLVNLALPCSYLPSSFPLQFYRTIINTAATVQETNGLVNTFEGFAMELPSARYGCVVAKWVSGMGRLWLFGTSTTRQQLPKAMHILRTNT